jgi:hypothetical protein
MSTTFIFTYNVNGISGKDKIIAIFSMIVNTKCDTGLFKEVHFKQADKENWEKNGVEQLSTVVIFYVVMS